MKWIAVVVAASIAGGFPASAAADAPPKLSSYWKVPSGSLLQMPDFDCLDPKDRIQLQADSSAGEGTARVEIHLEKCIEEEPQLPAAEVEETPFPDALAEKTATDPEWQAADQARIEEDIATENLSYLLSFIYNTQNNLVGSYEDSNASYQDLKNQAGGRLADTQVYGEAVAQYETALKNYGEYQAFLSSLPEAVSEYEEKIRRPLDRFAIENEEVAIQLIKTPALAGQIQEAYRVNIQPTANGAQNPNAASAAVPPQAQRTCAFMGALAGTAAAENLVLVTLANPVGAAVGAALGLGLCNETIHNALTLFPRRLGQAIGRGVVDLGSSIRGGLEDIGHGLVSIGKDYFFDRPAKAGRKIAEHYRNTKNKLKASLGIGNEP